MGAVIPQVITESRASGAQVIDGSLRFDDYVSHYLSRTPNGAGNQKTYTHSVWLKRNNDATGRQIWFAAIPTASNYVQYSFNNNVITLYFRYDGDTPYTYTTTAVFRDTSAWYNVVIAVDSTQATASDRLKIYVNGVNYSYSGTVFGQNTDTTVNSAVQHSISSYQPYADGAYFGGSMSQVYFIDGQALGAEYFGFTDPLTNTWRPKKYQNTTTTFHAITQSPSTSNGALIIKADDATIAGTISGSGNKNFFTSSDGINWTRVGSAASYSFSAAKYLCAGGAGTNSRTFVPTPSEGFSYHVYNDDASFDSGSDVTVDVTSKTFTSQTVASNFGTNGFYLPFDGNSPISDDKSGQGNDWTPVNFGGSVELDKATGALPILNTTQGGTQAGVGVFGSKENKYYTVTTANGSVYQFDITSGNNPSLEFIRGATYKFDYSSHTGHPVLFSSTNPDSSTTAYTDGTNIASNVISFTVPHNAPDTLYYYCQNHATAMNGAISVTTDETKADPYAWKNVLALSLVGSANDVSNQINSGSTTKAVTTNGDVAASSDKSNFYAGSFEFDGTGDYLNLDLGSGGLGDGDFTIEFWSNSDTTSGQRGQFQLSPTSGGLLAGATTALGVYQNGTGFYRMYVNNTGSADSTAPNDSNKWNHFAVVRSGGTQKMYVNGIESISASSTIDYTTARYLCIGGYYSTTYLWDGYIQDFRIYKGVAKYTSNFVVPATSPDILPDTPSGVSGGSELTKITDGAVSFDGNDYLSISQSDDFNLLDDGTFTIEFFLYARTLNGSYADYFGVFDGGSTGLLIYEIGSNLDVYINGGQRCTTTHPGTNKWHHIAVTRDGTTLRLFVDGISKSTSTASLGSDYSGALHIGGDPSRNDLDGYISNVRVIKGTALYTSNFTPPTEPLTNVTNTKLLCCQSNTSATAAAVGESTISRMPSGFSYWSAGYTAGWLAAGSKTSGASTSDYVFSALPTSGKHYWETTINNPATYRVIGVTDDGGNGAGNGGYQDNMSGFYYNGNPPLFLAKKSGGTSTASNVSHGASVGGTNWADGDIIQWAFDADNSKMWVGRNGTFYTGDPAAGTGEAFSSMPASPYFKLAYAATGGNSMTFEIMSAASSDTSPSAVGDAAATNFNPFNTDINTVRGQETGYCTLDPLSLFMGSSSSFSLSNGNLTFLGTGNNDDCAGTLTTPTTGKYFFEATMDATPYKHIAGWATRAGIDKSAGVAAFTYSNAVGSRGNSGDSDFDIVNQGTVVTSVSGGTGTVMGYGLDLDNQEAKIFRDGELVSTTSITTTSGDTWAPVVGDSSTSDASIHVNFGQKPFKFPPPDGFQPLNAANVRPVKVISRPDQYVGVATYTGNGGTQSISELNFNDKPDFVWIKNRTSSSYNHVLYDSVRGAGSGKALSSDQTVAEGSAGDGATYGYMSSFDRDGFTVVRGSDATSLTNGSGQNYVAWTWKAGGNSNTFNVDGVGYANASDVKMNVGGLNSTVYNTSQTWSDPSNTSGHVRTSGSYTPANMFNGILGNESLSGAVTFSTYSSNSSMTWTSPVTFNNLSSLRLFLDKSGSGAGFLRVNGNDYDSLVTDGFVTIPESYLSTIQFGYTGGTNTATGVAGIEVNGQLLIDSGNSVANVPSIAATGCSVGTKQGFSIIKWESIAWAGSANNRQVPHGLTQAPEFIITKGIENAAGWYTYHKDLDATNPNDYYLTLNTNSLNGNLADSWGPNKPDATTFGDRLLGWSAGEDVIAYCWHSVPGLQKFGKYVGNGNAEGPFIELGFRPKVIIAKAISGGGSVPDWLIFDSERDSFNPADKNLSANYAGQEQYYTGGLLRPTDIDFLSNGFKIRNTRDANNSNGGVFIYAAWAEAPTFNLYGGQTNAH